MMKNAPQYYNTICRKDCNGCMFLDSNMKHAWNSENNKREYSKDKHHEPTIINKITDISGFE
jgi:hypothetical protein